LIRSYNSAKISYAPGCEQRRSLPQHASQEAPKRA